MSGRDGVHRGHQEAYHQWTEGDLRVPWEYPMCADQKTGTSKDILSILLGKEDSLGGKTPQEFITKTLLHKINELRVITHHRA
jgi:FAD synthase